MLFRSPEVAEHVVTWLTDAAARQRAIAWLEEVARGVDRPGSAERAAVAVVAIARGDDPRAAVRLADGDRAADRARAA